MAATLFKVTDNDNEDEGTSDVEDGNNGSPWNCVFYGKGKCLYIIKNYRWPEETSWIGCEFPNCNDWYHKACLGLQLSARDQDSYTFVCNKHSEATGQFHTKFKASALDSDILVEKRLQRKMGKSSSEPDKDYSRLPSYVKFKGSFFYIHLLNFYLYKKERSKGLRRLVSPGGWQALIVTFMSK